MFNFIKKAAGIAGASLIVALSGCDAPGVSVSDASPQGLATPAAHYAAMPDAGRTVPAIPVEKVPPEFLRQQVSYARDVPVGTIVIDPSSKHLYLITAPGRAERYGIAVGRAGFGWSGEADITGRTTWPTWTPPPEMIARHPELARYAKGQPGGLTNPLGARALYLKTDGRDYGYRIHGTPEWDSIGHNASSGCIRMINQDVMDLYTRVPDGTHVIVLTEDGTFPTKLTVPPPAPRQARAVKPKASPVYVAEAPSGRV
ncbi:L,D-transpeptidase family protein [bacterium]|nr:L,D-transpeptidase family protein [bacterium]